MSRVGTCHFPRRAWERPPAGPARTTASSRRLAPHSTRWVTQSARWSKAVRGSRWPLVRDSKGGTSPPGLRSGSIVAMGARAVRADGPRRAGPPSGVVSVPLSAGRPWPAAATRVACAGEEPRSGVWRRRWSRPRRRTRHGATPRRRARRPRTPPREQLAPRPRLLCQCSAWPPPRSQALIAWRCSLSLVTTLTRRGFACSATGTRRVRTPAS